ncbi:MAG: hypothetical protein P8X95_14445 [Anaerolineales bacterium]|jgi:hypothetical protein
MQDRPWLTGDGGRETGEKLFSVHNGEPPFVGNDGADTFESPVRTGQNPKNDGAPPSSESIKLTVQRSSPVGVASLMGAVGGPVMERLSLSEGPGNGGENCTNIVAREYISAGKSVCL